MRSANKVIFWSVVLFAAGTSTAELQNIEVGGKLEIYGVWYSDIFEPSWGTERIPSFFLPYRPIGPDGTISAYRLGDGGNELTFVEQRTRLHVSADFTNHVAAFIEFDSIDTWGEDFRSDYITGADFRGNTSDDVELYQAFIEADQMFGLPVRLRIGRQELEFGSGWLVGADPGPDPFVGLSFDGLRLTTNWLGLSIDAWVTKVSEGGVAEQDGDVDFYGVYVSFTQPEEAKPSGMGLPMRLLFPGHLVYHGLTKSHLVGSLHEEDQVTFDLYWMFLRDGVGGEDTTFSAPSEWFEDLVDIDDYGPTELHTIGTRAGGHFRGWDLEAEVAYQWGYVGSIGHLFIPNGLQHGDDDATAGTWAGHVNLGYTFEIPWSPNVSVGGAYYGGEDHRGLSVYEWVNPFKRPEASVSFNRLFSSWREDAFIDVSAMTNFWKAYAAVVATPTESIEVGGSVTYLEALQEFETPKSVSFGNWAVPLAPALSFWTDKGARDLGWEASVWVSYAYSEDLSFELGYAHFFTGEAFEDGSFIDYNGLSNVGGRGSDDADTIYAMTTLEF
ncbi:MAG: alginate export family protein [Candidatus Hydrogenedentales bacterium]|jgi:hypothetical protein